MSVSEKDVRHIASLARLGMSDERVPQLVGELNRILEHMDVLLAVDLSKYESAGDIPGMPLRPDDSMPTSLQRTREEFAPAMRDGFFLVPKLDTHGTAASGATASGATGSDEDVS